MCLFTHSKLRHQAQGERFGYREVVLKGDPKKLNLHGVRIQSTLRYWLWIFTMSVNLSNNIWCHLASLSLSASIFPLFCLLFLPIAPLSFSLPQHILPCVSSGRVPVSVTLTADMCCLPGRLQSQRWAGSVAMPTCLSQEVSTILGGRRSPPFISVSTQFLNGEICHWHTHSYEMFPGHRKTILAWLERHLLVNTESHLKPFNVQHCFSFFRFSLALEFPLSWSVTTFDVIN